MLEVPKQAEEGSSQNSSQYNPPVSVRISVGGACGSPTRKEQMQKDPLSQQEVQSSLSQSDDGKDKESTEQGTSSGGPSDSIKICRVQAGSSVVQITIGDLLLNTKLDSGAEISILSSRMYDKLKKAPKKVQDVVMQMADAETALKGFIIAPISIKLGSRCFKERIYVAPIVDEMLLGHDILHHLGVLLDMQSDTLILDGEIIPVSSSFKEGKPTVARVMLKKRVVVPPYSVVRLPCKLDAPMPSDYVVESLGTHKVLMPRTVMAANRDPLVCFINVKETFATLRKNTLIAMACEVFSYLEGSQEPDVSYSNSGLNVSAVNENQLGEMKTSCSQLPTLETDGKSKTSLPEHLKGLYESSITCLNEEQSQKLYACLSEYQDVFAQDDFDLGTFTGIDHKIDTGDAKPIKQRMRRTPACFVNEEEGHLRKMLDAGVIQVSVSDWASSPVLIRKRDGGVSTTES
ncbi:uncharacterized protein LOC127870734 [Dreissena polymorpha]|uniref:uncharacterized protein LOC127870734 n=1 Tax=Dreissena polymorpha TaxID=45954 RepID=UPI002264609C|nr:uncharacterized protein LOC127870734 [Dreissena polymorpha]XP_052269134.1 uncharacterized protein LOC127870734 [Dreissena polymorpha]XP_052269135.1 uncharacterized protein LOC127870734 [Dreissena polymorpha]